MNSRFTLHMACCIRLILFLDTFHDISARLPLRKTEMREVKSNRTLPRACKAHGCFKMRK